MTRLTINTNEEFPHLPHAPIVEAVIDIRARPASSLGEAALRPQLEAALSGYGFLDSLQQLEIQHEVNLQNGMPASPMIREMGWKGLRFQSDDKKHIAQFNRDGFIFSRLEPYESWGQLYKEGMRLWSVYAGLAHLIEIHRIGLRYINRIQLPPDDWTFSNYLEPAPEAPKGLELPFHGFMHQDTLAVPDHPYAVNVIRTVQLPSPESALGLNLILDIDAFTTQGFDLNEATLAQSLLEMRWLKNKIFFGSVTPSALALFA